MKSYEFLNYLCLDYITFHQIKGILKDFSNVISCIEFHSIICHWFLISNGVYESEYCKIQSKIMLISEKMEKKLAQL